MLRQAPEDDTPQGKYFWIEGFNLANLWQRAINIAKIPSDSKFMGGIERCILNRDQLEALMELGVVNVKDYQNDSPTIWQLYKLSKRYKDGVLFEGYFVEPYRRDCRISIDGILLPSKNHMTDIMKKHYKQSIRALIKTADEVEKYKSKIRFWWD